MQEVWRRLLFSKSCYEPHLFGKAVDGGVDKAGGPAEDVGGQVEAALQNRSCYEPHLVGEAVDDGVDEAGGPAEDVGGQMEAALLRGRQRVHHSWTERAKVTKFEGLKI